MILIENFASLLVDCEELANLQLVENAGVIKNS